MPARRMSLQLTVGFHSLMFYLVSGVKTRLAPTWISHHNDLTSTELNLHFSSILRHAEANSAEDNSGTNLSQITTTHPAESNTRVRNLIGLSNTSNQSMSNSTEVTEIYSEEYCQEPMQVKSIIYAVFLLVVILVTAIGNITVLLSIILSKALLRQIMYYFLASLALSDILVALCTLPIKFKQTLHNQEFCMSLHVCKFLFISDVLFTTTSITHLLVIAMDRVLQIKFPFGYPTFITKKRSVTIITIVWLYSAIWAALSSFDWSNPTEQSISIGVHSQRFCFNDNKVHFLVLYSIVFIIPLIIMIAAYSFILKVTWRLEKKMMNNELQVRVCGRKRTLYMRELRASKTVVAVFTAFIVCYLPVCIITFSVVLHPELYSEFSEKHPDGFVAVYIIFVQSLPPLNHCLNPFIYAIMNQEFRRVFRMAILRLLGKPVSFNSYASPKHLNSKSKPIQQRGDYV